MRIPLLTHGFLLREGNSLPILGKVETVLIFWKNPLLPIGKIFYHGPIDKGFFLGKAPLFPRPGPGQNWTFFKGLVYGSD